MQALTICQPFARLIITGEKWVENRSWYTRYRGPLMIHAGSSRKMLNIDSQGIDIQGVRLSDMEFGACLGVVSLVDCVSVADVRAGRCEKKYPGIYRHRHSIGPFCWVLSDPFPLPEIIRMKGHERLWPLPEEVSDDVAGILRENFWGVKAKRQKV